MAPESKSTVAWQDAIKSTCHHFVRRCSITWRQEIHTCRRSILLSPWVILIGWVVDRGSVILSEMSWSTALVINRLSDMTSPKMHLSTSLTRGMLTALSRLIWLLRSYVCSSDWVDSSLVEVVRVSPKPTFSSFG